jgi:hypothetical protein
VGYPRIVEPTTAEYPGQMRLLGTAQARDRRRTQIHAKS